MGIIAILIGVLLPVLSGIAARGRDLQCQSNIRQCVALIITYASENKGQLPYGSYYTPRGSSYEGWGPADGSEFRMVHLWSVVSRMASSTYSLEDRNQAESSTEPLAPFLRCPEALQVHPHLCAYVGSLTAFITPWVDASYGASSAPHTLPSSRLVERPTKTSQLLPFTALVWETNVTEGMRNHRGWVVGWHVDNLRIGDGGIHAPQYRHFSRHDPFARISPGTFGNNRPILMTSGWRNVDPPVNMPHDAFGYTGTLRFRHSKNTTCNVGYADGRVERWTGKFTKDGRVMTHDALRKSFMVKWPGGAGIGPNLNLPH